MLMKDYPVTGELTPELFQNPTSQYRAAPFWAWNGQLETKTLFEQISCFKEMGFGGFHMHPRVGLSTPYLQKTYMERVRECVDKAKQEQMLAWLYDEDKWPSGFAGGLVTCEKQYRAKYLLFTPIPYQKQEPESAAPTGAVRSGNGRLLTCYDIVLNEKGFLTYYKPMDSQEECQGTKWYAYLETPAPNPWFNDQTYVNTLDRRAINRFLQITHEAYKKAVGKDFETVIPAIFTDEPQFSHKTTLGFAQEQADIILPWTDDLPNTFWESYGENLLENLPQLIWELPKGEVSSIRYHYHDHIAQRFTEAFADNCGKWCQKNNLMLTGHMMEEPTLQSQTAALGEAMRSYRAFGIPGIDMLCNYYEYNTAKQAQSAAHQYGRIGTLSELYGVTNWDFDFRGHKLQGDWQAALGVVVRVPHLAWMTMAGEAKRDYPASISFQSPWYRKYPLIENHFARVHTAMMRGKPSVKIGVIHPIESYWLHWGPREQTALIRDQMEERFQNLTEWLLFGTLDFDFICESQLPLQNEQGDCPLQVGEMVYDAIILPQCETIRSTTLERLSAFVHQGGKLLVLGNIPKYVDAKPNKEIKKLLAGAEFLPFEKGSLYASLENLRELELLDEQGCRTENLLYQMRREEDGKWLFIAQGRNPEARDVAVSQNVQVRLTGNYSLELYDTMTGQISPLPATVKDGKTVFSHRFWQHDSLLVRMHSLPEGVEETGVSWKASAPPEEWQAISCESVVPVTLSEPNVLLLDRAEYALDGEEFLPAEEILRADNLLRARLGWPSRQSAVAQPWTLPKEEPSHKIRLRFAIESNVSLEGVQLALEDAEQAVIRLNGKEVLSFLTGWYVDKSIKTVALPHIRRGTNILEIELPFGRRTHTEWCYLLGEFGVLLQGQRAVLTHPVTQLGFGDFSTQGLPFYGGNITYHLDIQCQTGDLKVHVPQYRGALISASLDGWEYGDLAFSPYNLVIPKVASGLHRLDLTLYGNRHNTFGSLHNADPNCTWFGPDAYRTTGDKWCYEYRLKPTGILSCPIISQQREKQK